MTSSLSLLFSPTEIICCFMVSHPPGGVAGKLGLISLNVSSSHCLSEHKTWIQHDICFIFISWWCLNFGYDLIFHFSICKKEKKVLNPIESAFFFSSAFCWRNLNSEGNLLSSSPIDSAHYGGKTVMHLTVHLLIPCLHRPEMAMCIIKWEVLEIPKLCSHYFRFLAIQ